MSWNGNKKFALWLVYGWLMQLSTTHCGGQFCFNSETNSSI